MNLTATNADGTNTITKYITVFPAVPSSSGLFWIPMRIAIVHKDRCHAKKCGTECIIYCPLVRTGDETVVIGEDGKAVISEEPGVGCGICIKKCPFEAIDIVSLPEELEHPTHRYGKNGFALYGLPIPVAGKVTGILGANGIGKSTAVKILSGQLCPNLGNLDTEVAWEEILKRYTKPALRLPPVRLHRGSG